MAGIRETYTIVITRPSNCSSRRLKGYIKESIEAWCGSFEPPREENDWTGDPLFSAEFNVVVRRKKINEEDE